VSRCNQAITAIVARPNQNEHALPRIGTEPIKNSRCQLLAGTVHQSLPGRASFNRLLLDCTHLSSRNQGDIHDFACLMGPFIS
jgi:hypothetical protein